MAASRATDASSPTPGSLERLHQVTDTVSRAPAGGRARPRPWLWWTIVAGALSVGYPFVSDMVPFDGLYLGVGVAAVAVMVVAIRRHRPRPAAAWIALALGVGLTVAGDMAYTWVSVRTGDEPPFPGVPDLLYLPGMAFLVAGGLVLAWQRHRTATTRSLLDAGLVAITAAVLLWLAVGADTLRGDEATLAMVAVGLAYPLMDAALIGVLAALLLGGHRASGAVRLLIAAFTVQFVTDAIYLTQAADGLYLGGGLLDSGWLLTYVLIAAAALHPAMAAGARPVAGRALTFSARHVITLSLPVVLASGSVLFVAHTSARNDEDRFLVDLSVLVPAAAIIAVLLLWRVANVSNTLARTARERDGALLRELVVADVASRLARADTIEEIRDSLQHARELLSGADLDLTLGTAHDAADATDAASVIPIADGDAALVARTEAPLDRDQQRALEQLADDVAMALDRCRLAEELRSSERRFRSLVRNAPDAITVHDTDGTLTYVSPALGHIIGVPEGELHGARWTDLIHPDDLDTVLGAHPGLIAEPTSTCVLEVRLRHRDGGWRWVETRLTNLIHDPSVQGIVANHRDITERQRLQRQLEHQATHDPLTGVANRRRFGEAVRELGHPGSDAIVFLDLDGFKGINDRFGHATGDEVLREVARRLEACVRTGDLVARLGGDEFAVLLRRTDADTASRTADRLLEAVRAPQRVAEEEISVSASVGLAITPPGEPSDDLLHDADLAMYAAKSAGRSRVELATPQVRERTSRRLELEADLRAALTDGALSLRYRPVADLATSQVTGAQAQLRWFHPTRGEIPVEEFLSAAARIGVLDTLASWIFHEACWSARSWLEARPDLQVAVPFPGVALRTPGLAADLEAALQASGLPGEHMILQIAGSDLLDRAPAADDNLERLHDAGVRIRATNLGTDTPMRVVRDAPVDEVLLSADLVAGLTAGPEEAALARAVLMLADGFGVAVVADGITTEDQRRALLDRGALRGTGPLIGAPVRAAELASVLGMRASTLDALPG